jgi:hypothetical protein
LLVGRSCRSLPVTDTGRSSGLRRRLGLSIPSVAELQGVSRLARSEDPGITVRVRWFPAGELNPAFRGPSHSVHGSGSVIMATPRNEPLTCNASEPPIGIEPMTYALRGGRSPALIAWPAQTARRLAPEALIALEFRCLRFHDSFHGQPPDRRSLADSVTPSSGYISPELASCRWVYEPYGARLSCLGQSLAGLVTLTDSADHGVLGRLRLPRLILFHRIRFTNRFTLRVIDMRLLSPPSPP